MKLVVVEIQAAAVGEIAVGVAVVQRRTGAQRWEIIDTYPLKSNDVTTKRTLLLDDDERVVIEGVGSVQGVYDPTQNMVKKVNVGEPPIPQFSEAKLNIAPGPLPDGDECQIGVWRDWGYEADWSRTGKRYRLY